MTEPRHLIDATVLVTGSTGLFGSALVHALAERNRVIGLSRYSDATVRAEHEQLGIATVPVDLSEMRLDDLPDADVVFHCGAHMPAHGSERDPARTFDVNVGATGRLMMRYQEASAFFHCSSASVYEHRSATRLDEGSRYGLHNGLETYAASKIAAEGVVRFLSQELRLPAVIARIFNLYGPRQGPLVDRVRKVLADEVVPLHRDRPNRSCPLFVADAVKLAQAAVFVADIPPLTVNLAGSETSTTEEYCELAAELAGRTARFEISERATYPLWPDLTRMHERLGRAETSVEEGVRAVVAALDDGS